MQDNAFGAVCKTGILIVTIGSVAWCGHTYMDVAYQPVESFAADHRPAALLGGALLIVGIWFVAMVALTIGYFVFGRDDESPKPAPEKG